MLPKIVTGWQRDVLDFILESGLNQSKVLTINGDKLPIDELREWLNFCDNLTRNDSSYVILLQNADLLTIESQSILLKPLEEKQNQVTMILLVRNENKVLPTILSRCEVVSTKKVVSEAKYWTDLIALWKSGPVSIINYCEKFDVDDLSTFLRETTTRLRIEINKGVSSRRLKIINCFLKTGLGVSTGNVNKRMALENLLFETWRMIKIHQ